MTSRSAYAEAKPGILYSEFLQESNMYPIIGDEKYMQ